MLKKRKTLLQIQEELLREEISKTQNQLNTAHSNFENVLDHDLIDCYIYEVNAAQQRYKFLIKQMKVLHDSKSEVQTQNSRHHGKGHPKPSIKFANIL